MSEVNHWPRCTTLRQVRDHFVGHPERLAWRNEYWALGGEYRRPTAFSPETGNRCPLGMIYKDEQGVAVEGVPDLASLVRKLGVGIDSLVNWHDEHECDPSKWPVELASDEILDREWA